MRVRTGLLRGALGALGLTAAIAMGEDAAAAPAFDRVVVIGDSLSDAGNAGRFTNGLVWVERLAERLGAQARPSRAGGSNFAVGGARLDPRSGPTSLRAQADAALAEPAPERARTLHVVYGGGNDLLAAAGAPNGAAFVEAAAASLRSILRDLAASGATDILVPNLPDVGITPAVRAYGPSAAQAARRLTLAFNARVEAALEEAQARPGVVVHRLDVFALAERAIADPAAYGFVDVERPCRGGSCEGRLFWDGVHPTAEAHARLADAAWRLIAGEEEEEPR